MRGTAEFRHDLAQPLRPEGRGNIHRMKDRWLFTQGVYLQSPVARRSPPAPRRTAGCTGGHDEPRPAPTPTLGDTDPCLTAPG